MSLHMSAPILPPTIPSPPPSPRDAKKPPMPALNLNITALPAVRAERLKGVVKSFSNSSGFGFIECEEVQRKYSRDVFLHKAQAGDAAVVGTKVVFSIDINSKGMPQARDVKLVTEVASMKFKKPLPPPPRRVQDEIPDLDSSCGSMLTSPRDEKDNGSDASTIVSVSAPTQVDVGDLQQQLEMLHMQQMNANMMGMGNMGVGMGMMNMGGMNGMNGMAMRQVGMQGLPMGNTGPVVYQPIMCPVICHVPVMVNKD